MERFVRAVIDKYNGYVSEARIYEKWLSQVDNPDAKTHLTLLELRVATIEAWFNLLNADERFVIEKHLLEELEWPRVSFAYSKRWNHEFIRTERSLLAYQTNALAKIAAFAERHKEIMLMLFNDIGENGEAAKP